MSQSTTGAALLENNEASEKLTTANGGTFTWAQLDSVANHVTACSISDWRALTWLVTETGWAQVNVPPFAVVSLSVSTWFHTTWTGGTSSRLHMCKSVQSTNNVLTSANESDAHEQSGERDVHLCRHLGTRRYSRHGYHILVHFVLACNFNIPCHPQTSCCIYYVYVTKKFGVTARRCNQRSTEFE